MSYTVLARRYRSNNFDQLVGQNHVAQTLKKAISSGRIAHAYLFCGTRGTGKTSTARILAKALNCQAGDGPTTEPCGKCVSCQAIARGDDMDVIEIDAASNTQVEKTREIIDNAQYSPAHSRFKIYIIDEVHMLSKSSFNALLKTLEEPPAHVKFILATTEPEKVLPTILSRCQRYDFRNIPTREIAGHLKGICAEEKIDADEDALLMIAKAGAGSMRDALSLLDRLLSVGEKHLTLELIEQMLGMPKSALVFELAQHIAAGDARETLEQADKMISSGLPADTLVAGLIDHLRNLLILRTCGAESRLVEVPGTPVADLLNQASKFDSAALSQDITILEELRRTLRQIQSSRALLDATLVRLALADQFTPMSELLENSGGDGAASQKKNGEVSSGTTGVPPVAGQHGREVHATNGSAQAPGLNEGRAARGAAVIPAEITPVADPNDLPAVWRAVLAQVANHGPSVHAMLSRARFAGIDDGCATIEYGAADETFCKMLERNGKKDLVRDLLSKLLNRSVGIKVRLVESPAAEGESTAPDSAPVWSMAEARKKLADDPWIKVMAEEFGGEIVRIEDEHV